MLNRPDQELVDRETAIPGLAMVLDPRAIAQAAVDGKLFPELRGIESTYLLYKPGTSCLAGFHATTADGPKIDFSAIAFSASSAGKSATMQQKQSSLPQNR